MSDRVECTVVDGVADVRLNRPEKLNALDDGMFVELCRGFCSGLDRSIFRVMASGGAFRPVDADASARAADPGADPDLSRGQRMVLAFRTLPVPVIAGVHGPALGGGLQLAMGAHIRIVAPDASLGMLEIRWGITPDMAGTQILPRLVGPDVAAELILGGNPVDGVEAVRIGLATRVADDPRAAALEFARAVAGRNPDAVRMTMRLLAADSFAEGLAAEREGLRTVAGSPNQREAVAAALEGRAAVFTDPD